MTRVGYNFVGGSLGADLGSSDTTITFSSAPPFDTLADDEYIPLVLDPAGTPEIVHLTSYTSGDTTGTIDRGSTVADVEGSRGTQQESHASGASWLVTPLKADSGFDLGVPGWVTHLGEPDGSPAFDDSFADETIDADYVQTTVSGTATWTEQRGVMSAKVANQGSGQVAALLYPHTPSVGEAIETRIRVLGPMGNDSSHLMAGPIFTDGTGTSANCVWLMPYSDSNWSLRAGTLDDINTTLTQREFFPLYRGEFYMRLIYNGTDEWHQQGSPDGVSWMDFDLSAQAFTLSPTHIGFGVGTWGDALTRIASFDYLRLVTV